MGKRPVAMTAEEIVQDCLTIGPNATKKYTVKTPLPGIASWLIHKVSQRSYGEITINVIRNEKKVVITRES
jgi:hypothetical protein